MTIKSSLVGLVSLLLGAGGVNAADTAVAQENKAVLVAAPPVPFIVIVHPQNAGVAVKKALLAEIFLRQVARWGDGTAITVVEQSLRTRVRDQFSRLVLARSAAAVHQYWLGQIFRRGERPPRVKGSDSEVVQFVADNPGSIGYVSPGTALTNVKSVSVID